MAPRIAMEKCRKFAFFVVLHVVPLAVILYFSITMLANRRNGTEGIMKLSFNLGIFSRGLPNPVQDVGSSVTGLAGIVPNVVSSAKAAVETLAGQALQNVPKGCTIGTKSACILYDGRSDCSSLPLKNSKLIEGVPAISTPLTVFVGFLRHTPSVVPFVGVGIASSLMSTIAYGLRYFYPASRHWSSALSVLGLVSFLVFATFTFAAVELTKGLEKAGSMERGPVYTAAIADLISAAVLVVVSMTSLYCGI